MKTKQPTIKEYARAINFALTLWSTIETIYKMSKRYEDSKDNHLKELAQCIDMTMSEYAQPLADQVNKDMEGLELNTTKARAIAQEGE